MGVSHQQRLRRLFEDEFARELKARGTDAVTSYSVIPEEKMRDREYIHSKIKELGADAVLVTMLVDKRTRDTYVPPEIGIAGPAYRSGWYGHYSLGYAYYARPGYIVRDQIVVLETKIYGPDADKPIFSALSETYLGDSPAVLIKSFVPLMLGELANKQLVK